MTNICTRFIILNSFTIMVTLPKKYTKEIEDGLISDFTKALEMKQKICRMDMRKMAQWEIYKMFNEAINNEVKMLVVLKTIIEWKGKQYEPVYEDILQHLQRVEDYKQYKMFLNISRGLETQQVFRKLTIFRMSLDVKHFFDNKHVNYLLENLEPKLKKE
uniref:Uncharacterized protein n=1 Tax=Clastoptera arizonana TaxID=38151 RepID=A0A1B6DFA7_9HEMI